MLALKIALRYLFAPKSHKAVNTISVISMAGVAVATMAIVVVLSVFNGFSDLAKNHLSLIDPDLKVVAAEGKVIGQCDSVSALISAVDGVASVAPVLTERGLLTGDDRQMPVVFKGIDPQSTTLDFGTILLDGVYEPMIGTVDTITGSQISVGVAMNLGLRPSPYPAAELYVPRRTGRINPANPAASYSSVTLAVTGVFRVDQPEYDADYMIIPIAEARRLLEYDEQTAGSLEITLNSGYTPAAVKKAVEAALGAGYTVQTRIEQQADTFRMISVEKWITFLMLVFILIIASFNIVSTLSLLVIEKRDNMATLRALGAPNSLVRGIFVAEGWLITTIGGFAGIVIGIALSLMQQHFGFIKLSADPSSLSIDVYPVRLDMGDVALVFAAVLATGIAIGAISRLFTGKIK